MCLSVCVCVRAFSAFLFAQLFVFLVFKDSVFVLTFVKAATAGVRTAYMCVCVCECARYNVPVCVCVCCCNKQHTWLHLLLLCSFLLPLSLSLPRCTLYVPVCVWRLEHLVRTLRCLCRCCCFCWVGGAGVSCYL